MSRFKLNKIFINGKRSTKSFKVTDLGGAANPSPPVGPALGAAGVNIMGFVTI